MYKQKETSQFVWYQIKFEIVAKTYIDKRGRSRSIYEPKYGLFKFDKMNNAIEIVKDKTDSNLQPIQKIKFACHLRMYACNKRKSFPSIEVWSSCAANFPDNFG